MPPTSPLLIDGNFGSGGGQILRPALTLAMLTGQPVQILDFKRNPGVRKFSPRYAAEIRELARWCGATWGGDMPRSGDFLFVPQRPLESGKITLSAGPENSACLLAQSALLLLSSQKADSQATVLGITHAAGTPTAEYLEAVHLPALRSMGFDASFQCKQAGFASSGELYLHIHPWKAMQPVHMTDRGEVLKLTVLIAKKGIDGDVGRRGIFEIQQLLGRQGLEVAVERRYQRGPGEGIAVTLAAECEAGRAGFSSHGRKRVRMEDVVDEACVLFKKWWRSGAACDEHMAEQMVLPMALAPGRSQLHFSGPSGNVRTALYVAGEFLSVKSSLESGPNNTTLLTVEGVGFGK